MQAVACYRMAIRTDRRHYNAWYGLGSIYHRQEKYDMAEYHFRRALSINPQSRWGKRRKEKERDIYICFYMVKVELK